MSFSTSAMSGLLLTDVFVPTTRTKWTPSHVMIVAVSYGSFSKWDNGANDDVFESNPPSPLRHEPSRTCSRKRLTDPTVMNSHRPVTDTGYTEGVSCLMITQPGRERFCAQSVASFARQTHRMKELIIVHDGDLEFNRTLHRLTQHLGEKSVRIVREAPRNLGWLRNRSIELAQYPFVCQWDDDDLNHHDRLALQLRALIQEDAVACFLQDQWHLFEPGNLMFWDDWSVEPYPGNLIQGTLLARRDAVGTYPDLPRGEDTPMVLNLARLNRSIAVLRGYGWLNIYRYTGDNAWGFDHHRAISAWKRLRTPALLEKRPLIEEKLREYDLAQDRIIWPHDEGRFEVVL
ncbi:MAG: glycosyltransferase family 2 protein [Proteobacteria bacterium]|nr:MAG: glycosyltransferase family 2 protein [Pseudomonadota bacterium]